MSFEKLIVNPLQKVWLVSLHCDYILSENRHTRVWLLLTFKRLHLMYCAESEMRFNCEFAVPLWINQCSKRWQGSWRVEQHYLTSIFSVFSVQRGFGAGVMDAFWVDSSYWSMNLSVWSSRSVSARLWGFSHLVKKTWWKERIWSLIKVTVHLYWFEETFKHLWCTVEKILTQWLQRNGSKIEWNVQFLLVKYNALKG